MGYKDFTAGEVLTANDVDQYLMNQTTMAFSTFAAGTAAIGTATDGMSIYDQTTKIQYRYNGSSWLQTSSLGAWIAWTPTITGTYTLGTGGVDDFWYQQNGKTVNYRISITFGSGASLSNATFTLPVAASPNMITRDVIGTLTAFDSSASNSFPGVVILNAGVLAPRSVTSSTNTILATIGATSPFGAAWASGDILTMSGTYESA